MSATSTPFTAPALQQISPIDLLFPDFAGEHGSTRRLLERFPDAQAGWRPHARSRTLAELASHIAELPNRGAEILSTDEIDLATRRPRPPLTTAAELLALHDASVAKLKSALEQTDFAALSSDWVFRRGPQVIVRGPRRVLVRSMMMSHLVHHRAQLGVYLRLLDIPIPGMYGPSSDDMAAMAKG